MKLHAELIFIWKVSHLGPVYTGPDKSLHGSTLRLHGTVGTGRIFERLSVQVLGPEKMQANFLTGTVPYLYGLV